MNTFYNNIKGKINQTYFIFDLLSPVKRQFHVSVMLLVLNAAWQSIILTFIATSLQSIIDLIKIPGGSFAGKSFFGFFYELSKTIPEENRVLFVLFLTMFSVFLGSLFNLGIKTYISKFSTLFIYHVRIKTFKKLLRNNMSFFDNHQKGSLIQMTINETRSSYNVLKCLLDILLNVFQLGLYLLFMLMISIQLSVIVFFLGMIYFLQNLFFLRRIKRLSVVVVEKTRSLMSVIDESIYGIKQIKLLLNYKKTETNFKDLCWTADFTNRKVGLTVQMQSTILYLWGLAVFGILISISFKYSLLPLSSLVIFLYILQKLNNAISSTAQILGRLNASIPAMNKLSKFLKGTDSLEKIEGVTKKNLLNKEIVLHNVSLSYGKSRALEEISAKFLRGQKIALVGESGSGKTSFINLLVKLYDPDNGEISIDGTDINAINSDFLRDKIGVVNQDSIIFNTTVKDNILMGRPGASDKEIIEASMNAYTHEFITKLPRGYETIVGDRGVKLSGGQRQRINLAQIILKDPEILILDEATSALDTKTEQKIQQALWEITRNKTTIIIAHRLSTIKDADTIIVLDNGRIVEVGNWSFLENKKYIFNQMIKRQSLQSTSLK